RYRNVTGVQTCALPICKISRSECWHMPLLHETSSTENDIEVGSRVLPTEWLVAYLTDQWAERSLPSDMMDIVKVLVMTSPRPARSEERRVGNEWGDRR